MSQTQKVSWKREMTSQIIKSCLFSGSSVLRLRGSSAIFSAKQSERTPLQNNHQVPELQIVKTFKHHVQADKESQPKTNCSCWNYCYCGSIWSFTKRAKFAFLHFLIFLQASTNISVFVKHVLFQNVQSQYGLDLGEHALNYKMMANSMKTMSKWLPNVIQCHPNEN